MQEQRSRPRGKPASARPAGCLLVMKVEVFQVGVALDGVAHRTAVARLSPALQDVLGELHQIAEMTLAASADQVVAMYAHGARPLPVALP